MEEPREREVQPPDLSLPPETMEAQEAAGRRLGALWIGVLVAGALVAAVIAWAIIW